MSGLFLGLILAACLLLFLLRAPWGTTMAMAGTATTRRTNPKPPLLPQPSGDGHGNGDAMRALLSALDSMVLELDHDGRLLRVLKTASDPMDIDLREHVDESFLRFLEPRDQVSLRAALCRTREEQATQRVEFTFGRVHKRLWLSASLSPLDGTSILAVVRNTTPARASLEKYREMVDLANCLILRLDLEGRITFLNEYGERFLGYSDNELVGRTALGTIVPPVESTGRDLASLMRGMCRDPGSLPCGENENLRKNGERVWGSWSNRPIMENGVLVGVLCVGTDITRQRRTMEELVRRERFHGSIIARSTDIITIVEKDGRILHESPSSARHLGHPAEEVAGTMLHAHIHPQDRKMLDGVLTTVLANPGDNPVFAFRRARRDGSMAHLEATATNCLDDDAVSGIILNCRAVTERPAVEEQLKRHVFLDA